MGNKHSTTAQHDKEFGSPDSRGRSWSFHGVKSKKASSKGAASSFRGRSSSLSDAATSKGKKGADVVVQIHNGKDTDRLAPGSAPAARAKWRSGGKGGGIGGEGGTTKDGGREREGGVLTTKDLLAARAHEVAARASDLNKDAVVRREKLGEGGKQGRGRREEEVSLSGRQPALSKRGSGDTPVAAVNPLSASSSSLSSSKLATPDAASSAAQLTSGLPVPLPPSSTPSVLIPHSFSTATGAVSQTNIGKDLTTQRSSPSSLLAATTVYTRRSSSSPLVPDSGPLTTDSGYSTVSRGVDSYPLHHHHHPEKRCLEEEKLISYPGGERVDVLEREVGFENRGGGTLRSNVSMSADELRQVSEALFGDRVLLDLVKRRGRASLNRDMSLSQTDMILTLAAEGISQHQDESRSQNHLHRNTTESQYNNHHGNTESQYNNHHGNTESQYNNHHHRNTTDTLRSTAETVRSSSLHSLDMDRLQEVDQWYSRYHDNSPHYHHGNQHDHHDVTGHYEEIDALEHERFRPRSNSATLAELNSRARARIAMGTTGARMRQSYASPVKENYHPGYHYHLPHPPSTTAQHSEEVIYAQKLLVNRALKSSSPTFDNNSGSNDGGASGGDGGGYSRGVDIPGSARGGGGVDGAKRQQPLSPVTSLDATSPSHYAANQTYAHVYAVPTFIQNPRQLRALPDIHENAPLSSSVPVTSNFPSPTSKYPSPSISPSPSSHNFPTSISPSPSSHNFYPSPQHYGSGVCHPGGNVAARHSNANSPRCDRHEEVAWDPTAGGWEQPLNRERSSSFTALSRPTAASSSAGPQGVGCVRGGVGRSSARASPSQLHQQGELFTQEFRQRSHSLVNIPPGGLFGGGGVGMARAYGVGGGGGGYYLPPHVSPAGRPLTPSDRAMSYSVTSLADQTLSYSDVRKDFTRIRDRSGEM
ncbi:hypothetical protein V1264_008472 [Littorina saxatilis]|uniref:Uncharacterized protein n=1 Tax=Littorina saxatilis TaxID=31220 RepID=A0AAN9G2C0_9CAEN